MIDGAHHLAGRNIHQLETDDFSPAHVLTIAIGKMAREINLAARIVASLFLRINILKLHQYVFIILKAVFLHIERNEDAVDVEHEILRIHTVENIICDGEGDFSLHAVRLSELTYLIYVVTSYHTLL